VYIYASDRRKKEIAYNRDMNEMYEIIRDLKSRLNTLEVWAGDGPEISAAMDSDEDVTSSVRDQYDNEDWGLDV
jgi:hypothetical protein